MTQDSLHQVPPSSGRPHFEGPAAARGRPGAKRRLLQGGEDMRRPGAGWDWTDQSNGWLIPTGVYRLGEGTGLDWDKIRTNDNDIAGPDILDGTRRAYVRFMNSSQLSTIFWLFWDVLGHFATIQGFSLGILSAGKCRTFLNSIVSYGVMEDFLQTRLIFPGSKRKLWRMRDKGRWQNYKGIPPKAEKWFSPSLI